MNELDILARKYGTDKRTDDPGIPKYHGYVDIYYDIFKNIKDSITSVLEIGIQMGGSLFMWKDYFPNAQIYGIDNYCEPTFRDYQPCVIKLLESGISVFIGDATDFDFIDNHFRNLAFDVIVDDGSHRTDDQRKSLFYLFNNVKPGGHYFIEDLDENQKLVFKTDYVTNIENIERVEILGDLGIILKKEKKEYQLVNERFYRKM
jgi:hypothetical protein